MCIMADQQFCLRWNNHQSTLVSVFDTLLEKNVLVDCTLAAEGQYLKAHKVVLCACSPYLETLLSDHAEKHPIIILKDVKYQELKNMMDYMYKGEVNISQDDLEMFLKTAESLQIKGLTDGAGEHSRTTKKYDQQHRKQQQLLPSSSNLPQLPSGLTVESTKSSHDSITPSVSNSAVGSREGSISPIARKRRRPRSLGSNGFDDNSMSYETSPVSLVSTINNSRKLVEDDLINVRISQQSTFVKEEIEPECDIIEPKSEYLQELNNDNILTLADDDDTINGVDIETGSSHAGDNSNHMYSWPRLDDRSSTDVYGTSQHGDNQEIKKEPSVARKHARSIMPIIMGIQSVRGAAKFACPNNCGRFYKHKCSMLQHFRNECGKERQFMCNICYRLFNRKSHLKTHLGLVHQVVVTNV